MLTSTDYALLAVLDETGGLTTGGVSKAAQISYGGNARQRSGAVRSWLNLLLRDGYVRFLDDQKPDCWCRTPKGTAALEHQ